LLTSIIIQVFGDSVNWTCKRTHCNFSFTFFCFRQNAIPCNKNKKDCFKGNQGNTQNK
jgi:hypothetical protein